MKLKLWMGMLAIFLAGKALSAQIVPSTAGRSDTLMIFLFWFEPKPGETKATVTKQSFFAGVPYGSQEIKSVTSLTPQYQIEIVENHSLPNAYKLTLAQGYELTTARPQFYGFAAQLSQQQDLIWKIPGGDVPAETPAPPEYAKYLLQTKTYDLDSAKIRSVVAEIVQGNPGYIERLRRIWQFVNTHMKYTYAYGDASFGSESRPGSASKILASGKGRCGEFSSLTIALARGAGIPARMVSSLEGKPWFSTSDHAWAETFVPGIGWIPLQTQKALPAENDFFVAYHKYYVLKRYASDDGDKWIHNGSYNGKGKMNRGHVGIQVDLPSAQHATYLSLLQSALTDDPGNAAQVLAAAGGFPAESRPLLLWILTASGDETVANEAIVALGKEHRDAKRKPADLKKLLKMSPEFIRNRLQKAANNF